MLLCSGAPPFGPRQTSPDEGLGPLHRSRCRFSGDQRASGDIATVEILLDAGADASVLDGHGYGTPARLGAPRRPPRSRRSHRCSPLTSPDDDLRTPRRLGASNIDYQP